MQVVQTGKSRPGTQRVEPSEETANRVRPADRHDHHPFRLEIPATAHGSRFQRDLVADAFDEHHSHGAIDLRQGTGRCPDRSGRATHVAIERPAGKLTAMGDIHGRLPVQRLFEDVTQRWPGLTRVVLEIEKHTGPSGRGHGRHHRRSASQPTSD
jgi:hypothetical protein